MYLYTSPGTADSLMAYNLGTVGVPFLKIHAVLKQKETQVVRLITML